MNLYNKDITMFYNNILKHDKLELFEYNNSEELKSLNVYIKSIQNNEDINLNAFYNLIETEVIFSKIFDIDTNKCKENILNFDLNIVNGTSIMHEFIKVLQYCFDMSVFNILYKMMVLKFFKDKKSAEIYSDNFITMCKTIDGIDHSKVKSSCDQFISLFDI
jgi:hypothetical protein